MPADRPSFFDHDQRSLRDFFDGKGIPPYVGDQLLDWVYRKRVTDPAAMTNLSRAARRVIEEDLPITTGRLVAQQDASDGTRKLLVAWREPHKPADATALPVLTKPRETECVMIPAPQRLTACISSQVGCPVGCRFCASGLGGLEGNLRTGEIVEQAYHLGGLDTVDRISNVVFMGMGEPLANFAAVTNAIRTLNADWGLGIGARRITVSTVGLPAAIRKLVHFDIPVTLALSLHAPNDKLRRKLIPWAEYAPIDELLASCQEYFEATGREITLEYLLLRGVNDQMEHAAQLASVARRLRSNINLIRYNEVEGLPFERPRTDDVRAFQRVLRDRGVNAHIRASRGRDISAACGQLRHEKTTAG